MKSLQDPHIAVAELYEKGIFLQILWKASPLDAESKERWKWRRNNLSCRLFLATWLARLYLPRPAQGRSEKYGEDT